MSAGYNQFCPVAMAAEVLCTRWTVVLLREMVAGSTRFNDLRRGVPSMSPALLVKRLKELEDAGLVERHKSPDHRQGVDYHLTASGRDVGAVVEAIGHWGQAWVKTRPSLDNLDAGLLMWDMRRNLRPDMFGGADHVVEFCFTDQPASRRSWWLVVQTGGVVDLCSVDPGLDVTLAATCSLRTMTAIWMGLETVATSVSRGELELDGEEALIAVFQDWLGLSPFAKTAKKAL